MIGLPEDMMNTEETSFDATNDPSVDRVILGRVDVSREGVQLVPIYYREDQPKRLKRGGGRGKDVGERGGLKKGEMRREYRRPIESMQRCGETLKRVKSANHEGVPKGGPIVLWAKRHEDFRTARNRTVRAEEDHTTITEGKMVALRVPNIFVGEAIGEEKNPLCMRKGGIVGCHYEAVANVQAVHVEDWRGKSGTTLVSIFEGMYPASVASHRGNDRVGR